MYSYKALYSKHKNRIKKSTTGSAWTLAYVTSDNAKRRKTGRNKIECYGKKIDENCTKKVKGEARGKQQKQDFKVLKDFMNFS